MTGVMRISCCLVCVAVAAAGARAAGWDELRVKREAVFEFARKPTVVRDGDRVAITFTSKGYCDATLAIEDAKGRIVRHLASGVLGDNAPEPFRKKSKRQTVIWDGKDDRGRYVDATAACRVRVSLGLKARFERTLFWSPKKRTGDPKYLAVIPPVMVAAPEGVYVCEGGGGDHVRLFDHDGNYLRTVYPFPAARLDAVRGLKRHTFPQDGKRLPLKWGLSQNTLLTSARMDYGGGWPSGGANGSLAATAAAAGDGWIALANARLNRLATDDSAPRGGSGQAGGLTLAGPATSFTVMERNYLGRTKPRNVGPRSAALSPDGKRLYLTGYHWREYWGTGGTRHRWLNCVTRLRPAGDAPAEVFAGSAKRGQGGTDDRSFRTPVGVACDGRDRVYVADYTNDRIQVYAPEGKLVRTLQATKPAHVAVHHRTGEVYIFSWQVVNPYLDGNMKIRYVPTLTRLPALAGPPRAVKSWPLPLIGHSSKWNTWDRLGGTQFRAALDTWTDPPRVWLGGSSASGKRAHIRMYEIDGEKLTLKRDFAAEATKAVTWLDAAYHGRQRLYCNPATGWVYAGHQYLPSNVHSKSIRDLIGIDPASGKVRMVPLPFDAEDLTFDMQGRLYLRLKGIIARYEAGADGKWREIPFGYGEERRGATYHGYRRARLVSAAVAWGGSYTSGQFGGIAVSPAGHIAMTLDIRRGLASRTDTRTLHGPDKRYTPRIYPGRAVLWVVHVWDERGKILHDDALPGMGICAGLNIDKDDSLYIMAAAQRMLDGKPYVNDAACTLIKVRPGKAKVLSSRGVIPLGKSRPQRPADLKRWRPSLGASWVESADWLYGGVGLDSHGVVAQIRACHCEANSRPALDYFARSFLPEINRYDVAVVDTNGNTILRIGRYGNVDDGLPLVRQGGPARPRSIGGDEVALMHGNHLAVDSDRRLFISDLGNARILSVKLGYHATETVALKGVADRGSGDR